MPPTIVHFTTDTLPRVVPGQAGLDLVLPFRIDLDPHAGLDVVSWRLTVEVNGQGWSTRARVRRLRPGLAASLRERMQRTGRFSFEHLPFHVGLDDAAMDGGRAVYLEGRLPDLPPGATVRYALQVDLRHGGGAELEIRSPTFTTHAVDPRFTRDDIRRVFIPAPGRAESAWVLHHRRTDGLDQVRVDVLDLRGDGTPPERAQLHLRIGDTTVDLPGLDPAAGAALPLVDISADSVTVAVPHGGAPLPPVVVRYRGTEVPVDLGRQENVGETRLMFVNFAIQGLNDLFAVADDDYDPPRTYMQVTMRDEAASYSSRPGSYERRTGDGYAFTLDAHRRFGIPQMWAMNGGLLGLLAHDCPGDLAAMRTAVDDGLLVPVVAGYGAHRLPYYTLATNVDAIAFGAEAMEKILGTTRPVYYPDSRITHEEPEVADAVRQTGMEYLVVDAGTTEDGSGTHGTVVRNASPPLGRETDGRYASWQNLWRDRISGTTVLFIDREAKDGVLGSDDAEANRGSLRHDLRRKFLELAAQPTLRAGNLVVYSDDADKASGNGWFDGVYHDEELPFNHRYQAALSWVAAHPWVRVVTTDDLAGEPCVGELDLVRATDPVIERDWNLHLPLEDGHDHDLVYDTWYAAWARTRAAWLGEHLRAVSDRAERAIARRRADGRHEDDELVLLARLYFTMCLHESQWSQRARDGDSIDAEHFVIAESLQLRNAHVYLNASFWAQWAAGSAGAFRDRGPVVDAVAAFEEAGFPSEPGAAAPPWWCDADRGLQWDHDPLATVVLYNEHALVVLDRNGGRITHLFVRVDGRPVAVSGTHKAYQFADVDWSSDGGVECDGLVLQNTVWTPNHAYVACDVDASRGTVGVRPSGDAVFDWYYPDNFNLYDEADPGGDVDPPAVRFRYGADTGDDVPTTMPELDAALDRDRVEKRAGRRGIVLHDVHEFGAFGKTITLDGRTVHVEYRDTRPGHRVANEFCVDLLASALHGTRQRAVVDDDGRAATVRNDEGLAVRLELGPGCAFSRATMASAQTPTVDTLRLHRVMTDDLEIVAPDGGDFSYRIVLP